MPLRPVGYPAHAVAPAVLALFLATHAALKALFFSGWWMTSVALPVEVATGGLVTTVLLAGLVTWALLIGVVAFAVGRVAPAEAGLDLLTFYTFPKAMWKSLRTTNALENLNREFRRRTKTQASFSTEAAAVTLLFGLVAFGHITFRKLDGHRELPAFLGKEWSQAA